MQSRHRISDTILLSLACLGGAVLAVPFPFVGLPLSAAALSGLIYTGRIIAAVILATLSSALVGSMVATSVFAIVPAMAALLFAIVALRRHDPYVVTVWLAPVLAISFAARDLAIAWLAGQTYGEFITEMMAVTTEALATAGFQGVFPADAVDIMIRFAPIGYLLTGVVSAIPVVVAISWAASRTGVQLKGSSGIENLDFSPHVLWPLVFAITLGAAGRIWDIGDGMLTDVGWNLLLATKFILFLQGFAVAAFFLKPMRIGRGGLFFVGVLAFIIDGPTWIVSIAGLLDFWFNFRKLSREGASGSQSTGASNNRL